MKYEDTLIWGKSAPQVSLIEHMLAVGACTTAYLTAASSQGILERLSRNFGLEKDACIRLISYVFALHDIGKAHPAFLFRQEEIKEKWLECGMPKTDDDVPDRSFRHEVYSDNLAKQ